LKPALEQGLDNRLSVSAPRSVPGSLASKLTKKDLVVATVRTEIRQGRLAPGTRLRQHEVAARLGVSPTPVREAFSVLALEGLLEWDAYRGVTVARDLRGRLTLADLYELRGVLETVGVRIGARSADPGVLRMLAAAEEEARQAGRASDVGRWRLANSRFHAGLVDLGRSDLLSQLMGIVLRASMYFSINQSERVHREHRAIMLALLAGDADAAVRLVGKHTKANVNAARRQRATAPSRQEQAPSTRGGGPRSKDNLRLRASRVTAAAPPRAGGRPIREVSTATR
jgi:DNA-binding GntR family transcriptional regulator